MVWLSVEQHPFPKGEFIAAWIDKDDEIAQIEWYTHLGGANFMNVNTSNINEFDPESDILIRQPPNFWIAIPPTPKEFWDNNNHHISDWGEAVCDYLDNVSDEEFKQRCIEVGILEDDK